MRVGAEIVVECRDNRGYDNKRDIVDRLGPLSEVAKCVAVCPSMRTPDAGADFRAYRNRGTLRMPGAVTRTAKVLRLYSWMHEIHKH